MIGPTFLTRIDDVGVEPYDSIGWAFEIHVKQPDTGEYNFALLYGNEDSPVRIEFYRKNENGEPDWTWEPKEEA